MPKYRVSHPSDGSVAEIEAPSEREARERAMTDRYGPVSLRQSVVSGSYKGLGLWVQELVDAS